MFVYITRTLKPKPSYFKMLNLPRSAKHSRQSNGHFPRAEQLWPSTEHRSLGTMFITCSLGRKESQSAKCKKALSRKVIHFVVSRVLQILKYHMEVVLITLMCETWRVLQQQLYIYVHMCVYLLFWQGSHISSSVQKHKAM